MKRYLVHDADDGTWNELPSYEVAEYVARRSSSRILMIDVREWMGRAEHGMTFKLEHHTDQRIVVIDDDRLIPSEILQPA